MLRQAIEAAAAVEDDDDVAYLERHGWSRSEIDPLAERLRNLTQQLERYALRAELMQTLPPVAEEQLGLDDVLEEAAA